MGEVILHNKDCLEILSELPDNSVDSVVTDPPYGLGQVKDLPKLLEAWMSGEDGVSLQTSGFMSKEWDVVPPPLVWKEVYRVLKPGGHLLCFAGTRTQDLMGVSIRLGGFELRDEISLFGHQTVSWLYGQGFPKSRNLSKTIDAAKGEEREVVGTKRGVGGENLNDIVRGADVRDTDTPGGKGVGAYGTGAKQVPVDVPITAPSSDEATRWDGWGTCLKPCHEPILMFRKPIPTITSDQIHEATGWTHWVTKRTVTGKKAQVFVDAGFSPLTDDPVSFEVESRKSLCEGEDSLIILHHNEGSETVDSSPYKRWTTKTVTANTLVNGVGGINIDKTRIGTEEISTHDAPKGTFAGGEEGRGSDTNSYKTHTGRWPSNVAFTHHPDCEKVGTEEVEGYAINRFKDGAKPFGGGAGHEYETEITENEIVDKYACDDDCQISHLDEQAGERKGSPKSWSRGESDQFQGIFGERRGQESMEGYGDTGGASRFFHTSDIECDDDCLVKELDDSTPNAGGGHWTNSKITGYGDAYGGTETYLGPGERDGRGGASKFFYIPKANRAERNLGLGKPNKHPTVKPIKLMQWLVDMVTPTGGVVLDPFTGSGTTGIACIRSGFDFIGIEREQEYFDIAKARLRYEIDENDGNADDTSKEVSSMERSLFG